MESAALVFLCHPPWLRHILDPATGKKVTECTRLRKLIGLGLLGAAILCLSPSARGDQTANRPVFGVISVGGSLPINSTTSPSDAGLRGSLAFGVSPIPSTPEIVFSARGNYDRFFGNSPARWIRSLFSADFDLLFYPNPEQQQRWYLFLGAGFGYADQQFAKVTDPMGCIGVGADVGGKRGVRYVVEARLSDLSNSTYGDFRFLSVTFGLKF
jgi:hypothetical protein